VSILRFLPQRIQERIKNYAPRGFPDPASCGAFYDARARLFGTDEAASLEYSSLKVQRKLFARAVDALPPHGRVLDVGCGLAHLASYLEEKGLSFERYHGIDVSPAMISRALRRVGHREGISFEARDVTTSPISEGAHDVSYIISVLGYPIGEDPMATMLTILRNVFDACTDGLVFSHVMDGRSDRTLAFPTVPQELAARCEEQLGARATIHDDGADFTYLISLRRA